MFSHGRSLTSLLIVFFVLLFIPVIGPFLAIFVLAAGGAAYYHAPPLSERERKERRAEYERRKAEWHAGKAEIEAKRKT